MSLIQELDYGTKSALSESLVTLTVDVCTPCSPMRWCAS